MKIFVSYRTIRPYSHPFALDTHYLEFDNDEELLKWIEERVGEKKDCAPIYQRERMSKKDAESFLNLNCVVIRGERISFTVKDVEDGINIAWPNEKGEF